MRWNAKVAKIAKKGTRRTDRSSDDGAVCLIHTYKINVSVEERGGR